MPSMVTANLQSTRITVLHISQHYCIYNMIFQVVLLVLLVFLKLIGPLYIACDTHHQITRVQRSDFMDFSQQGLNGT